MVNRNPLAFGIAPTKDVLDIARRDYEKLKAAVQDQDPHEISDCLFNYVVTAYSVKDWLRSEPTVPREARQEITRIATSSMRVWPIREISNAYKHASRR